MGNFGQPPGAPPGPPPGGFGQPPGGGFGQPPGGGFGQPPGYGQPPGGGGFGAPPGGFGGAPGGSGGAPMGGAPKNDPLAITSAIVGGVALAITFVLGCCCGFFGTCGGLAFGGTAVVLGVIALRRIGQQPDQYTGKGLAIAGTAMGGVSVLVAIVITALLVMGVMSAQYGNQNQGGGFQDFGGSRQGPPGY